MGTRSRKKQDAEKWEKRELGAAEKYAAPSAKDESDAVDSALGLQLISIRLQGSLIEDLKELAVQEGLGYQPLMRMVLTRYVKENEHKLVNHKVLRERAKFKEAIEDTNRRYGKTLKRLAES